MGYPIKGIPFFYKVVNIRIMSTQKQSNQDLYMWAVDFYKDYSIGNLSRANGIRSDGAVNIFRKQKKDIVDNFFNKHRQNLINARAGISSMNSATAEDLDAFFNGPAKDGAGGFMSLLQKQYSEFYTNIVADAKEIFKMSANIGLGSNLNVIMAHRKDGINLSKLKQGDYSKKYKTDATTGEKLGEDVDKTQAAGEILGQEFSRMWKAQTRAMNSLEKLSSFCDTMIKEEYGLNGNEIHFIRKGNSKVLAQSGSVISLDHLTNVQQSALKTYVQAKEDIAAINSAQVSRGYTKSGEEVFKGSFSNFAKLLSKFHYQYEELVFTETVTAVQKMLQEANNRLYQVSALATGNAHMSGSSAGQISVETLLGNTDPGLLEMMKGVDTSQLKASTWTAKNDSTMTVETQNFVVELGANIKGYSNRSLQIGQKKFIVDTSSNILASAQMATGYGLPKYMATEKFIGNMIGSLYGSYGPQLSQVWELYKNMLAQLLYVDALMGRMVGTNIETGTANSLLFVVRGHIFYLPSLLAKIEPNQIEAYASGKTFYRDNSVDVYKQAEADIHYKNLLQGVDPDISWSQILDLVHSNKTGIKIVIDLNNFLSQIGFFNHLGN